MTAEMQLSPQETSLFQALVKPGAVYLLMLRLDRPIGAREVADILGIHEQTAARYLRTLARLNLVARTRRYDGYVLLGDRQLILGELTESLTLPEQEDQAGPAEPAQPQDTLINSQIRRSNAEDRALLPGPGPDRFLEGLCPDSFHEGSPARTTKISQSHPIIINKLINNNLNDSIIIDSGTSKNSQSEPLPEKEEVWHELTAAGIFCNPRTQALVCLPHITPEYVRAQRLKLAESGQDGPRWTGLLVTILERGDPAPELNPGGHLASCRCNDCRRQGIADSWG